MRPMSPSRPNSGRSWTGVTNRPAAGLSVPARAGLALIRAYKLVLSPWFAGSCRYVPGCADYAALAADIFRRARVSAWVLRGNHDYVANFEFEIRGFHMAV